MAGENTKRADRMGRLDARIPELDGLRGVAVLLVLAGHLRLAGFGDGGSVGVTLFFVLSGYLITGVLLEREGLETFYVRRAARLIPALAVLLAVVTLAALVTGAWASAWTGVWSSVLYVSNFVFSTGQSLGPLDHMWSLATEEQFYLLWPWVILFLPRRWAIALALVGIVLAAGLRVGMGTDERALWASFHLPWTRMDALLIGCLARIIPVPRPSYLLAACAAAVIAVTTIGMDPAVSGPVMLLPLALAAAIVLLRRPALLRLPILRWFGTISYALYLWHFPLIYVFGPIGGLLSVPIAWASTRFVEMPIRRWVRQGIWFTGWWTRARCISVSSLFASTDRRWRTRGPRG